MSELDERRWSVISERGSERTELRYDEAVRLAAQLRAERVSGLVVVSSEAARRLAESAREEPSRPAAPD